MRHTKKLIEHTYIPAVQVKSKRILKRHDLLSLERQGEKGYALCSWEIQERILRTAIDDQAVPFYLS